MIPFGGLATLVDGGHHQIRAAHSIATGEHLGLLVWKAYSAFSGA